VRKQKRPTKIRHVPALLRREVCWCSLRSKFRFRNSSNRPSK